MSEIEGYQKVIDGARAVVENWRPRIAVDPEWPVVGFQKACKTVTPPRKIKAREFTDHGRYPIIDQSQNDVAGYTDDKDACLDAEDGLVIFGDHTCVVKFVTGKFVQGADGVKILRSDCSIEPKFLYYFMSTHPVPHDGYRRHFSLLTRTTVMVPPKDIQREIIAELDDEEQLVDANRRLIERMEVKVREVVGRVW